MKVNTKDTDSLFEKGSAKYHFNSEKKNFDVRCQIDLTKAFRF